jgi:hypothetical protein
MRDTRDAYKYLGGKSEGERSRGRRRSTSVDNIEVDIQDIE